MDYILSESSSPVEKKSRGINRFVLKIIAYIFMIADLIGYYILETHVFDANSLVADGAADGSYTTAHVIDLFLRLAGGIAFPIFCFLLVVGFLHTSNVAKYITRLAITSIITEFIWDIANNFNSITSIKTFLDTTNTSDILSTFFGSQNPLFTLLIGLIILALLDKLNGHTILSAFCIFLGIITCSFINSQFGSFGYGVMLIVLMYYTRDKKLYFGLFGALLTIIASVFNGHLLALLAFAIIPLYNGKRGPRAVIPFYFVYPVTLLILHIIGALFF